ncbi:MAG: Hsp20/alpha crystallin family protein [Firmicutes bacterium]|nr:Hsp20/alpha crystallin family protein [Bacillota bacterium]
MSIMRWDPFGEISNLRNQMNRFFDQAFRKNFLAGPEAFGPRIDLYQTENEVIASAELPGVQSKDDIEVTVAPESLTIKGELKRNQNVKDEHFFHTERYYGTFQRTLPLPAEVKPEETRAEYQNGLLEIHMPKSEKGRRKTHRVEIH